MWVTFASVGAVLVHAAFMARAILRPHRDSESRIAWVVAIAVVPVAGIIAYILFGETNIGRKRAERVAAALATMPPAIPPRSENADWLRANFPERCEPLFRQGETINGFAPVGGNSAQLMADSNRGIDSIVADMDAARDHIHLIFYIWLEDYNGSKVIDALKRAAARGVSCRAMADGLGSRAMIRSKSWQEMRQVGVQLAVALRIDHLLMRVALGRIDLRNHRKIVVIDNRITYCGSQNCADPEFRVKPKFAPWVDALMRFEGPIARQNQHVFIGDWMSCVNEDIRHLLEEPIAESSPGFTAQVIATGPTVRNSAMPETFETLMHAARHALLITTPYFVPKESMQAALCAAAHRGVDTTIIFPARNDSWEVAATSRSYYLELLEAGVKVFEYVGGLLHTKSVTVDDDITLIGSANMDRRSFDLNYENNILFFDRKLTGEMQTRQRVYLAASRGVRLDDVAAWSLGRRLWHNVVGMMSPLL
ncbi:MAG: cardiolipin synthase [Xanthomonadales bacterium]|nr:cardiolipin synthase [Xanthomonadales bacterium]